MHAAYVRILEKILTMHAYSCRIYVRMPPLPNVPLAYVSV
jgi:hypothetical protein